MRLPSMPLTLRRGVGRRILGFFILAGLLPVLFTAGLAYYEMGRGLSQDVGRTLREHAKDYGLGVLTRLQLTHDATEQLAFVIDKEGPDVVVDNPYLLNGVETVWLIDEAGGTEIVFGNGLGIAPLADLPAASTNAPLADRRAAQFPNHYQIRSRCRLPRR